MAPHSLLLMLALPLVCAAQRTSHTANDGWLFRMPQDTAWQRVNLPHTYNLDAYQRRDYYRGKALYRHAPLPAAADGRRTFLRFEAASKAATVSAGGRTIASHAGGYTAFNVDLTGQSAAGQPIDVEVDNARDDVTPISADFTFWGGVYRDVHVIETDALHFDMMNHGSDGVFVSTPRVADAEATVSVRAGATNDSPLPARLTIVSEVRSPEGALVATMKSRLRLAPGETRYALLPEAKVKRPQLWSPEAPRLYRVSTKLVDERTGRETDRIDCQTAFRYFAFDGNKGFSLNGRPYKLRGFNRHQDQKPYGPALSDDCHRRDIRLMKSLGANFIRIAHYPQDKALLDACDQLGMLAWEEIPCVNIVPDTPGYDDNADYNLREMIRQHYNHPSIIAWGYMNEILLGLRAIPKDKWPAIKERTLTLARRLEKTVKEEDKWRVSVMAFHGQDIYSEAGLDLEDVCGWNLYPGWYGGELADFDAFCRYQHEQHPDHPMIISEWGAGSDRRLHSLSPERFDFTIEYQQTYVEHYLPFIERTPWICGSTYWNFIDFNCAYRQESMPRTNNKGVFLNDRTPKDIAYYFKAMWTDSATVCHIVARDWPVRPQTSDGTHYIKVYSNAPEVALSIDGRETPRQRTANCSATFAVKLTPGRHVITAGTPATQAADCATIDIEPAPSPACGDGIALNLGSEAAFTSTESHRTWLPLSAVPHTLGTGAESRSTTSECQLTPDGPLYQTWLEGDISLAIPAPDGRYEVELLTADFSREADKLPNLLGAGRETSAADAANGPARYDITICGRQVESAFTPAADGQYRTACRRRYTVDATGGAVTIQLKAVKGKAALTAVAIYPRGN